MINKPTIIITSIGRTGTKFFAQLFREILKDNVTYHEPEKIIIKSTYLNLKKTFWVFKNFGLINSTLKKITGSWGIRSISNRKIMDKLTTNEARLFLIGERKKFIESHHKIKIYVESSYHFYGLIDIIPISFKYHNTVYIIRNGRNWIRSHMDKTKWYSVKHIPSLLNIMLTPWKKTSTYNLKWKSMTQFEKLCWFWSTANQYALNTIENNPNAKLFYFEDIFESENKYANLKKLIDFVTTFKNFKIKYNHNKLSGILEKKINNPKKYTFPSWENWTEEQKNQFNEICGPLMKKLGYDK
jgi:hypothetical protein